MTRPEDDYPFDRNARACILRIGTIVSATATRLVVTVPGGQVTDVAMLSTVTVTTAGTRVALLLDRDSALAIGNVK